MSKPNGTVERVKFVLICLLVIAGCLGICAGLTYFAIADWQVCRSQGYSWLHCYKTVLGSHR